MKVRIILKAKKDFGTLKVGENMTLINEVFDLDTGIAFYPIDKNQWEVIGYDLSTGKFNKHNEEIFGGDILKGGLTYENTNEYPIMVVRWNESGFNLIQINGGKYTCPIRLATNTKRIGNVHEHPELMSGRHEA
jgi:hypothetical protein